ncbi:hypothetical protein [Streptococcus azizii]|uniref:DUF551 domain-containing protein n=1 Tax=Streptococcus azizii TaxID=1579424 RepID=A0AB36JR86_9STRE|nr:hypothetical protein [Streptococcus azizii]ONK25722.1 hypothetical protein BVE86_09440 [Streptococcus azizii]
MKWNKLTTRPLEEEEKKSFPGCAYMWDGESPDIDEEVLVYVKSRGVYTDTWIEYSEGVGFENTYEDDSPIYWMSFPEPSQEVEDD